MCNGIYSHSQFYFDDNFQYQNATDMILRNKLAELLIKQELHLDMPFDKLQESAKQEYSERADEIIELVINTIKNLEFSFPPLIQ